MAKNEVRSPVVKPDHNQLLQELRALISDARQRVTRAVDEVQVQTYWQIGKQIVEFDRVGRSGQSTERVLLANLAQSLTAEFGRGFDTSNLRNMHLFYRAFPIRDELRHELSWITTEPCSGSLTRKPGSGTWTKLRLRRGPRERWNARSARYITNVFWQARTRQRFGARRRARSARSSGRETLSAILSCWSSSVCQEPGDCSKRIWSRRSSITCRRFF